MNQCIIEDVRDRTGWGKWLLWLNDTEKSISKRTASSFWSDFIKRILWRYLLGISDKGAIIMLIVGVFRALSDKNLKPGRFFCRLNYWSVGIYGY